MAYYRIHLKADDGDSLTVFVPLTDTYTYDPTAPKPHLARAVWDGDVWHATFRVTPSGTANEFVEWSTSAVADYEWVDTDTDLLTVPVRIRQAVEVDGFMFKVVSLERV